MPGFLTLTTPLLLGGLSLLALPLIAHWMHRRSRRTIVFPTVALLIQTAATQSQFHRLRRWLLLALRLVAVACVVMAFTRPVWQATSAGEALSDDSATAAVVVLDVSASTGQRERGVSELERLKAEAISILGRLQPGLDLAGIVLADASPRSLFPRLSRNLGGLRGELDLVRPRPERADWPAALAAATELLSAHDGPRRLFIVSDLQRSNWRDVLDNSSLGTGIPEGTIVEIVPQAGTTPNVGLHRSGHFPPQPLSGEPFEVTVEIANHSPGPRQVPVRCERTTGDGAGTILGSESQTVSLQAGERRNVAFRIDRLDADRQFVRFEADLSDGLAIDNAATLVVETALSIPVIVLSDDESNAPGTAGYYLLRSLAPEQDAAGRFRPVSLTTTGLTPAALRSARIVVAGYLGALSPQQAETLRNYVRGGGSLILFSGEGPVDRNLNAIAGPEGSSNVLPWSPGPRRTAGRNPAWYFGSGRWQSRWLRAFDEQSQVALQQIRFQQVWSAGALSPAAEVLLSFQDGSPALGVRSVGRGLLVVANFSPEPTTSDLARHGAFVALMQMLVQAATPPDESRAGPVPGAGWTFRAAVPPDETVVQAQGPGGESVSLASTRRDKITQFSIPRLDSPGIYTLWQGDQIIDAIAVAVDERESDLERIDAQALADRLNGEGHVSATASAGTHDAAPLRGQPLWGGFLAAAMIAIGLELLLLGWWRR